MVSFCIFRGLFCICFLTFLGVSPCRRLLELGNARKVGFRHGVEAGGRQQGGTVLAPAALGPTCPGSAGSAAPHEGVAVGTLSLCLRDVTRPAGSGMLSTSSSSLPCLGQHLLHTLDNNQCDFFKANMTVSKQQGAR